jgi:hypothetical protein
MLLSLKRKVFIEIDRRMKGDEKEYTRQKLCKDALFSMS